MMIKILTFASMVIVFCSCSDWSDCNEIDQKIMKICAVKDSAYIISLASLTDFEWDTLYVVRGPTIDNDVEKFIGIRYRNVVPDDSEQYIFAKEGEIIEEYISHCGLGLSLHPAYSIGRKYSSSSSIRVKWRGPHYDYTVEEVE